MAWLDPNESPIFFFSFVFLAFVFLTALAVMGVVLRIRQTKQRSEDLRRLAPSVDMAWREPGELNGKGSAILDAAGVAYDLEPDNRGEVTNLLHGRSGRGDVWLFDYHFHRVQGGDLCRVTVVSVELSSPVPAFRMGPEGAFERLTSALGCQDIDFPENPQFSRLYKLQSKDEPAVRALFPPTVLDFFAARPGHNVAGKGACLLIHSVGGIDGLLPVADVPAFVRKAVEIAAVLRA